MTITISPLLANVLKRTLQTEANHQRVWKAQEIEELGFEPSMTKTRDKIISECEKIIKEIEKNERKKQ